MAQDWWARVGAQADWNTHFPDPGAPGSPWTKRITGPGEWAKGARGQAERFKGKDGQVHCPAGGIGRKFGPLGAKGLDWIPVGCLYDLALFGTPDWPHKLGFRLIGP